jgi:hypothetical protein
MSLDRWVRGARCAAGLCLLLCAALPAAGSTISYRMSADLPFVSPGAESFAGAHAGSFSFDERLLPSDGNALVSWAQMETLSFDVGGITLDRSDVAGGQCGGGALPVCGVWFRDGELQGFVNQFVFPETSAGYRLRLQNTSGELEGWSDPRAGFQSIAIEDLGLGFAVASGFVEFSRVEVNLSSLGVPESPPVPEPGGLLLFAAALIAAAKVTREAARERR